MTTVITTFSRLVNSFNFRIFKWSVDVHIWRDTGRTVSEGQEVASLESGYDQPIIVTPEMVARASGRPIQHIVGDK